MLFRAGDAAARRLKLCGEHCAYTARGLLKHLRTQGATVKDARQFEGGVTIQIMTTSTIGRDTPQINALEKVLGKALYSGDLKMAGMLHAKVLRSPYAHARIVASTPMPRAPCRACMRSLTGDDTPTRMTGIHHKQHRILATGKVRFIGEEVVAVVAEDEETARDAIDLIRVEYEELPVVLDPDQALQKGTIEVHEGSGNLACQYNVVRGDVDAAFARAALVHEDTYETHSQYPGYLEPMATLAWRTSDGRVNV